MVTGDLTNVQQRGLKFGNRDIEAGLGDGRGAEMDSRQRRKLALQQAKENSDPEHWQTTKSEFTRESILHAIVECLAEFGYSNLTLGQVARKAGLSKGAMQHHFESKSAAIEAALQFIFRQQLELQQTYVKRPCETQDEVHSRRIDAFWDFVQDPSYTAFLEIAMAARTDPHLRELVNTRYRQYLTQARSRVGMVMPEWQTNLDQFKVISRLTNYVLEAMALRKTLGLNDETEDAALREHIKRLVGDFFEQTQVEGK